jgi:glutamine synthetase
MQILQNVARRYGLVCLLHEKPFAGVNGSGKHNNWSMGTDTGDNLLEPGATPHENLQFLFFCAAVIQAVDDHQQLLRASVANAGQDHRLGANEAPPAIISIFLGAELEKIYNALEAGSDDAATPAATLELGASVLPPLPMHGGDRNRTSPFAFTGNKFEFRALGSSMSLALPNTVLNTIVAEAVDQLCDKLEAAASDGAASDQAVVGVVREAYSGNKQICFDGDNYADSWHQEAEQRGLSNLRTTPDALPWLVEHQTIQAFERYDVLSERELESRFEVFVEQYTTNLNIEAETAASIARTMLLPASVRHLAELRAGGHDGLIIETEELVDEFVTALQRLEEANAHHPAEEGLEYAKWMRDNVIPAMDAAREIADRLERIVADDLWPLPKYSEMLFIK